MFSRLARDLKESVAVNRTAPSPSESGDSRRRTASSAVLAAAGIGAAFLATGCCVGPLLLAAVGLSGAGLVVRLEPYRPFLAIASVAFILGAMVATRRRSRQASADCTCAPAGTPTTWAGRFMVWLAVAVAVALLAAPYVVERWTP